MTKSTYFWLENACNYILEACQWLLSLPDNSYLESKKLWKIGTISTFSAPNNLSQVYILKPFNTNGKLNLCMTEKNLIMPFYVG